MTLALGIAAAGCSGASAGPSGGDDAAAVPAALELPLATSLPGPGGTWATLAMGHLDQPLNTFWQLLFLPTGARRWSNEVQATGTGTNGGIVLSAGSGGTLVAGVLPSNYLHYSPLAVTSDAGASWAAYALGAGLVHRPDSFASGGPTGSYALAGGPKGTILERSEGTFDDWHTVGDQRQLASSAGGRACGATALTALSEVEGEPVVGTACNRSGAVGVMVLHDGGWQLVGPTLPPSLRSWRSEVLTLWPDGGGLEALVGVWQGNGVQVLTASSGAGGNWQLSPPLSLGPGQRLVSTGPTGASGVFVLTTDGHGDVLQVNSGPADGWTELPSPPARTATVAFPAGAAPCALAVNGAVLSVWSLQAGTWARGQTIDVPIQYGSAG